jgi:hypothetical protein
VGWIEILSYAVAGAVGAVIANLIVGTKKERRGVYIVVFIVAMYAVHALTARFALRSIYDWKTDRELRNIALYSEIADSDPETYKKLKATLLEGEKKGESKGVIEHQLASIVEATMPRYVPNASDESINAFVSIVAQDAHVLNRVNPDACYQFLYPQKFSSPNPTGLNAVTTNIKTLSAMADVLHSATHNPQPPPDAKESEELLEPIRNELAEKYGSDLLLVQGTAKDSAERGKVCNIAIDAYSRILNLPPKESSEVLRDLLSSK